MALDRDSKAAGLGIAAAVMAAAAAGVGALLSTQLRRDGHRRSFASASVLITGGSRGFGLALARRFADEGARLAIVARDRDELERAAKDLRRAGAADVLPIVCDVRNRAQVEETVAHVVSTFGRLDVLVNNAGVIHVSPFAHTAEDDFRESLDTHFWGPLFFVRACLRSMRASGGGHIVNVSSVGGRVAVPHLSAYCVGKFALTGLSEALRTELAPHGISVTTVTPFVMRTGSHRNVIVRGQHEREALWFALGTATRLSSIDADRAAGEVVEAVRDRQATVAPGWQSRAAELAQHIMPELASTIAGLVAEFVLPAPSSTPDADEPRRSRDLDLTPFARFFPTREAERFNQPIAGDERRPPAPPRPAPAGTLKFAEAR